MGEYSAIEIEVRRVQYAYLTIDEEVLEELMDMTLREYIRANNEFHDEEEMDIVKVVG